MIRLRTLGLLDLRGPGGEEVRAVLAQPRRAALLAYLALATPRGPHLRDKLLALFWPELDSERARNALGQALHFLRRAISSGAIVNRDNDALGLDWNDFWCDAAAFEEALDGGRIAEAVGLYRGDLLDGFHIDDAPDFERWLDGESARLAGRYTKAVETLAAERESARDYQGAVAHWQVLAARDPYSSRLAVRLMRALVAAGDPAAALQLARQHERLVRDEMGIAPDAEVGDLVRQLQEGRPPTPSPSHPEPSLSHPERSKGSALVEGDQVQTLRLARDDSRTPGLRIALIATALVVIGVGVVYAVANDRAASARSEKNVQALYDRGKQAEVSRSLIGLQTAGGYYRRAIELDTNFAQGYAALSQTYARMAFYDYAPKLAALDTARLLAQRAVALDSTLPETRTALGVSLANDGHLDLAEHEFREAIKLGPNDADAPLWYSQLLVGRGRGEEAQAQAERAIELNPVAPRAAHGMKWQANFVITGQRGERNLPTAERRPILQTETGEPWALAQQAVDHARERRCPEAQVDIARARSLVPDINLPMLAFSGIVSLTCGDTGSARIALDRMKRSSSAHDHAFRIALLHARLGELDSAFARLEHHRWLLSERSMMGGAPLVDPLRSHPRFPGLLRQLGYLRDSPPPVTLPAK